MTTYTATVLVTMHQEMKVEANSKEEAELLMIEQFNKETANFYPAEVYDLEEEREGEKE